MLEQLRVSRALLALDRKHRALGTIVQQLLRRLPSDHTIRDRVGVALVGVARLTDAPLRLDATALLNAFAGDTHLSGHAMRRASAQLAGGSLETASQGDANPLS